MTKTNPFTFVKSINEKNYLHDLVGYVPYLVNRALAMHMDCVLLAEEMNQAHNIGIELQYEFYYYSVRQGKRFGYPPKPVDVEHLELVQQFFGYSREKAIQSLQLLTQSDIMDITRKSDHGGQ